MGYYYEHSQGERFGKAKDLVKMHNGKIVSSDYALSHNEALFCVVNNGPFEAAAFCFNSDERALFNCAQDTRPKTWVVIPMSELLKAVPLLQNKDAP